MPDNSDVSKRATLVRWATRWDRNSVVKMMTALTRQHGVEAEEATLSEAFDYSLSHPDRMRFAVVQRENRLIGIASLNEAYSSWQADHLGRIEDFYVIPEERGSGVGTQILALLVDEGRRRGYCRLELCVQEDNDTAWRFYETHGFSFTGYLVYKMDLQKPSEP